LFTKRRRAGARKIEHPEGGPKGLKELLKEGQEGNKGQRQRTTKLQSKTKGKGKGYKGEKSKEQRDKGQSKGQTKEQREKAKGKGRDLRDLSIFSNGPLLPNNPGHADLACSG
jgi:hypothetical protein